MSMMSAMHKDMAGAFRAVDSRMMFFGHRLEKAAFSSEAAFRKTFLADGRLRCKCGDCGGYVDVKRTDEGVEVLGTAAWQPCRR
jgi:hypothetical protein